MQTAPLIADVIFITHSLDQAPLLLQLPSVRWEAAGEQQTLPVAGLHRGGVHGKGGAG